MYYGIFNTKNAYNLENFFYIVLKKRCIMKLSKLTVSGYKNLIDCTFEMNNFNVLIGSNNSGKSNLLEIFSILDLLINGSDESKDSIFKGNPRELGIIKNKSLPSLFIELEYNEQVDKDTYNYLYSIELEYENVKLNKNVLVPINNARILKETFRYKNIKLPGRHSTVFERNDNDVQKLPRQIIQKVDKKEPVISLISKIKDINDVLKPEVQKGIELLGYICKTPIIYNSPNEIRNSFFAQNENIVRYGKVLAVPLGEGVHKVLNSKECSVYKDILDEVLDIKDINTFDFNDIKFVTVTYDNNLTSSIQQLSDGTLIALSIITYLFTKKFPIIAIEELENSLHPKLLKKLIFLLKNDFSETQIIITTHSPILLNLVQIDDVSVITKNKNGAASIFRVKDKKDLVKKLDNPLSSFGDIFYVEMD